MARGVNGGSIHVPDQDERAQNLELRSEKDSRDAFGEEFAKVWAAYPRKIARASALRAYIARRREGVRADVLHMATQNYARACAGKDVSFVMHGATFFGPNERWADYVRSREPEVLRGTPPPPRGVAPQAGLSSDDWERAIAPETDA